MCRKALSMRSPHLPPHLSHRNRAPRAVLPDLSHHPQVRPRRRRQLGLRRPRSHPATASISPARTASWSSIEDTGKLLGEVHRHQRRSRHRHRTQRRTRLRDRRQRQVHRRLRPQDSQSPRQHSRRRRRRRHPLRTHPPTASSPSTATPTLLHRRRCRQRRTRSTNIPLGGKPEYGVSAGDGKIYA